ncbi:hypothetical protein NHX12_029670 [Muraenolepis orangiensis]|uniref:LRRNT domain-containing protein n=1 Tax=Muraenolepis orangiensis TaxID=630683 RepID=A0A9Q0E6N6_9TELE|nr:hypothetical protein NHX12_029670 [Muraenolepis orangiensis]
MSPCVCWLQPILVLLLCCVPRSPAENCPTACLCPDPHTVDCSGRGLTRLPQDIPLDVRRLLLADNWIPRIPADFLVLYSDLVYLDLRNNSLSHIEVGTLSTSSRLVFLDLGSNNLTEIPKGTFGESRSLIKLRLGNNPYLSAVNEDAFLGLTSLRELELERNALSTLQVGALSQLPSLRLVRLEGNPWVCNCNFASLFAWLMENSQKLPNGLYDDSEAVVILLNMTPPPSSDCVTVSCYMEAPRPGLSAMFHMRSRRERERHDDVTKFPMREEIPAE